MMRRCFFEESPLFKKWRFNPCGESKLIDGQMMCTRDKNKLREWGCLYKCEYEQPRNKFKQIEIDFI